MLVPGSLLSRAQPLVDPRFVSQVDLNSVQNVGPLLDALHLDYARNRVSSRLATSTPKKYGEGQRKKERR